MSRNTQNRLIDWLVELKMGILYLFPVSFFCQRYVRTYLNRVVSGTFHGWNWCSRRPVQTRGRRSLKKWEYGYLNSLDRLIDWLNDIFSSIFLKHLCNKWQNYINKGNIFWRISSLSKSSWRRELQWVSPIRRIFSDGISRRHALWIRRSGQFFLAMRQMLSRLFRLSQQRELRFFRERRRRGLEFSARWRARWRRCGIRGARVGLHRRHVGFCWGLRFRGGCHCVVARDFCPVQYFDRWFGGVRCGWWGDLRGGLGGDDCRGRIARGSKRIFHRDDILLRNFEIVQWLGRFCGRSCAKIKINEGTRDTLVNGKRECWLIDWWIFCVKRNQKSFHQDNLKLIQWLSTEFE